MTIPEVWPTPNNPDSRLRVFRIEIERPLNSTPVLTFHMQEAITVGTKDFIEYRPDLALTIDLAADMADPILGQLISSIAPELEEIAYELYTRKYNELNTQLP